MEGIFRQDGLRLTDLAASWRFIYANIEICLFRDNKPEATEVSSAMKIKQARATHPECFETGYTGDVRLDFKERHCSFELKGYRFQRTDL
jgi:hypothetical protein